MTENKTMKASDFYKKIIVCLRERTLTFFFRTTTPVIAQTIGIAIAATIEATQVFFRLSKTSLASNLTLGNTIERLVSTWEYLSTEEQAVLNVLLKCKEFRSNTTPL